MWFMTLPNKLTIFRIFLVIPFMFLLILSLYDGGLAKISYYNWNSNLLFYIISFIIFSLAMLTDFIDGKIARNKNQITTFGKIFDPLADKIIINSTLIIFTVYGVLPIWLSLVIILRDTIIDGLRMFAIGKNINISASFLGKLKTMLLTVSFILIFLISPFWNNEGLSSKIFYDKNSYLNWILLIPLMTAMSLSVISGFNYFFNINKYIIYK